MVDRFTITAAEQDPWIDADPSGQWVRYSDYAALEAQLAARTGGVKPLDEDDYEEIISAAAINMRKAASGIRGQVITVQDSIDWWVMKETERRILSALLPEDAAGLVERLRQYEGRQWETTACYNGTRDEAASLIQSQAARIAELEAGMDTQKDHRDA